MTPQERAERVLHNFQARPRELAELGLVEDIRKAIVEATNEELERRRAVEAQLATCMRTLEGLRK